MAEGERVVDLSPELLEELRACEPIEIEGTFPYVPRVFRLAYPEDKSKWPVFELRHLDSRQLLASSDKLYGRLENPEGGVDIVVNKGAHVTYVCFELGGVVSWRNFSIEYEGTGSLLKISPALLIELCNAITGKRVMTEEEVRGLR